MKIKFRKVSMEDAERIFNWLNDKESRAASIHTQPVEWETHCKWLEAKLAEPTYHLNIAEVDETPVGYFRMDISSDEQKGEHGYVSYIIDPAHRGHGIGKPLVHAYLEHWPLIPIFVDARDNNPASVNIIRSLPGIEELKPVILEDGTKLLKFVRRPINHGR